MSSSLNKIHVSNSTGLSLNERFTAIISQPKVHITNVNGRQSRSRSRSVQRPIPPKVERVSSRANHRLLAQLQRKHKMQTALKLKRRSMRTVGGVNGNLGSNVRIQRGSVKAFRVGANGKPIKTNSLTNIVTMKADRETLNKQRRALRRSNSTGGLANRLGPRRPAVGGAAQRVAKRNFDRQRRGVVGGRRNSSAAGGRGRQFARDGVNGRSAVLNNRGRSRSRSRTRTQSLNRGPNRSRPRNPEHQQNGNSRGRSRSRNRNIINVPDNNRRGRSLNRGRWVGGVNNLALPVKSRLGVRPGPNNGRTAGNRGDAQNNRRPNDNRRNASLTRRGVQSGRVQKRRSSTNQNIARSAVGGDNNGRNRVRSRSAVRNATTVGVRAKPRSRSRKGQVGQQRQQQGSGQTRLQQQQQRNNRAPRGRSQQRRGGNKNGRRGGVPNNNGKGQTQQRRGRSRSRTGRGAIGGQRNQGNRSTTVNKDDLDKELDQYMATTKTENDMDYLLKN